MNIQSLDQELRVMNKDGSIHPELFGALSQIIQQLQRNLSDEGYKVPQQPTTNITQLNTQQSMGALLYDNTTNELKVNINGTFRVVQVV